MNKFEKIKKAPWHLPWGFILWVKIVFELLFNSENDFVMLVTLT